jgi:cell division protein ZapA (FtsZ GTPase activity inhibitor)
VTVVLQPPQRSVSPVMLPRSSGSGSSSGSMTPPPPAAEPEFDHESGCLIHPVDKKDTLAGLAIRYGVKVEDIKRINRLWNSNEIWMYRTLKIPADIQQYRLFQQKKLHERHQALAAEFLSAAARILAEVQTSSDDAPSAQDVEALQLDTGVALKYLEENRFSMTDALAAWRKFCQQQFFEYDDDATLASRGRTQLSSVDISSVQQRHEDHADEVFQL